MIYNIIISGVQQSDLVLYMFLIIFYYGLFSQFSSVTQSCLTLCDPMNRSMPGLPVHHQLPEFTQTHVHRVGDAIQPSHPLLSPSPPAPNPSQHYGLLQNAKYSSLYYTVYFCCLSILYIMVCICESYIPNLSLPHFPLW